MSGNRVLRLAGAVALFVVPVSAMVYWALAARSTAVPGGRFIAPPQADELGTAVEILSRSPDRAELLNWYKRELAEHRPFGPPPRGELASLETDIRGAGMSALEMFAVGAAVFNELDPWSASVWVRVATDKAMQELPADPASVSPSDMSVRQVAMAMHDSNKPLWATGNVVTLERQCAYNMRLPAGVLYPEVPTWARLGYAQALWSLGKQTEAWATLDAMAADERQSPDLFTLEQRAEIAYARGSWLMARGDDADAVLEFQRAAATPQYHQARFASEGMMVALARLGRREEAVAELAKHVEEYDLTRDQALQLAGVIEEGLKATNKTGTASP